MVLDNLLQTVVFGLIEGSVIAVGAVG